jgi:phage head maturation protease
MGDEIKIGSRHNKPDRGKIREIRKAARLIDSMSIELEPNDDDHQEPEGFDILAMFDPEKSLVAYGNEVKALGDGKIGGYLVRFSTPADPDLTGEFFSKDTEFGTNTTPPLFYHHGMDGTLKTRMIGQGAWKIDDIGLWYEAQIAMRTEYEKYLYQMVQDGLIGYSSGALSHLVERETVGKAVWVKTWIIGEASLTPAPAEYRNEVTPLKSLSENIPLTNRRGAMSRQTKR